MTLDRSLSGAKTTSLDVGGLTFTAYEMGQGPLVLCLHGFPDTPGTWRHLLPALAHAGYRAVAVTSRGYEATSQPLNGDYGLASLAEDVGGWIAALEERRAHLVGHDWGASIACAAAAKYPKNIASLVTLAVPHPAGFGAELVVDYGQQKRSWYIFLFQLAGLSELIVSANDFKFLEDLWRDWSPSWAFDPAAFEAVRSVFAQPGVLTAALGYYRSALDGASPRREASQTLMGTPIVAPTLGLTGDKDGCINAAVFERSMRASPFSLAPDVRRIPDAGHFLQLEAPQSVNQAVLEWLKRWA